MNIKVFLILMLLGCGIHCAASEEDPICPYGLSNGLSFIPQDWSRDPKPSPLMIRVKEGDKLVALLIGTCHTVPLINLDMTFLFDTIKLHRTQGIKFFSEIPFSQQTTEIPFMKIRSDLNEVRDAVDKDNYERSDDIIDRSDALETIKVDGIDIPAQLMKKWSGFPKKVWDVLKEYSPKVLEVFAGMADFGGMNAFNRSIGMDQAITDHLMFFGVPIFGLESMETRANSNLLEELPSIEYGTGEFFRAAYGFNSAVSCYAFKKYDETYKIVSEMTEDPSDEPRNKQMAQVFLRTLEKHLDGRALMPVGMVGCAHFVGSAGLLPSLVRWVDAKDISLAVEIKDAYGDWMPAPRDTFGDPSKGLSMEEFDVWKKAQVFEDEAPIKAPIESLVKLPLSYTSRRLETFSLRNITFAFVKRGMDELRPDEAKMLQSYDIVYMRNAEYLKNLRMMLIPHLDAEKNTHNPSWANFVAYEPYISHFATEYSRDYFKENAGKYPLWAYFFLNNDNPVLDVITHDTELAFRLAFDGTHQEVHSLPVQHLEKEVATRKKAAEYAALHPLWKKVGKSYDFSQEMSTLIASLFISDVETREYAFLQDHTKRHVDRITSVPKEFYFPELEALYRDLVPDLSSIPAVEEGKKALILLPFCLLSYAQQKYLQPLSHKLHEFAF
jgi:hypothetical protein